MSFLMDAVFILSAANILLLVGLLNPTVRNLLKTRAAVAAGLTLFAVLLLAHNLLAVSFHATMMPLYNPAAETEVFALTAFQTVGFGVLLWVTYR